MSAAHDFINTFKAYENTYNKELINALTKGTDISEHSAQLDSDELDRRTSDTKDLEAVKSLDCTKYTDVMVLASEIAEAQRIRRDYNTNKLDRISRFIEGLNAINAATQDYTIDSTKAK